MKYVYIAGIVLLVFFFLFVFFCAVMKLRDIRDAGELVGPLKYLGYATLAMGLLLDFTANIFYSGFMGNPMGLRYLTVSEQTYRLALEEPDCWRGRFSNWLRKIMLSKIDKSGGHDPVPLPVVPHA
jgi:hypothetical protein